MTVEERARQVLIATTKASWNDAIDIIAKALRDQIEDCAKLADTEMKNSLEDTTAGHPILHKQGYHFAAKLIANKIRALVGQSSTEEREKGD